MASEQNTTQKAYHSPLEHVNAAFWTLPPTLDGAQHTNPHPALWTSIAYDHLLPALQTLLENAFSFLQSQRILLSPTPHRRLLRLKACICEGKAIYGLYVPSDKIP
jgi:hypothetical protein